MILQLCQFFDAWRKDPLFVEMSFRCLCGCYREITVMHCMHTVQSTKYCLHSRLSNALDATNEAKIPGMINFSKAAKSNNNNQHNNKRSTSFVCSCVCSTRQESANRKDGETKMHKRVSVFAFFSLLKKKTHHTKFESNALIEILYVSLQ